MSTVSSSSLRRASSDASSSVQASAAGPGQPPRERRSSVTSEPAVAMHFAPGAGNISASKAAPGLPRAATQGPEHRAALHPLSPGVAWQNTSAYLTPADFSRLSAVSTPYRQAAWLPLKVASIQQEITRGEWSRAASMLRGLTRKGCDLTELVSRLKLLAWTPEGVGMVRALGDRLDRELAILRGRQPLGQAFLNARTHEARRFAGAFAALRDALAQQHAVAPEPPGLFDWRDREPLRAFGIETHLSQIVVQLDTGHGARLAADFAQDHAGLDGQVCDEQAWLDSLAQLVGQHPSVRFSTSANDPTVSVQDDGSGRFLRSLAYRTKEFSSQRLRLHAVMRDGPELLRAVLNLPDAPIALPATITCNRDVFCRFVRVHVNCAPAVEAVQVQFLIHEDELEPLQRVHANPNGVYSSLTLRCPMLRGQPTLEVAHNFGEH